MSTDPTPVLRAGRPPECVRAVALVLHGGKDASHEPVRPWQLAGLRMWPFTWALRRAGGPEGLAVMQLQYRFRGWNGVERSPVRDARWALARIHDLYPGVRVIVIGHSMGGRTAAAVSDDPSVVGVLALAPWWPDGGETAKMEVDQRLVVVHGTADRWTDPVKSSREADDAAGRGVDTEYLPVPGGHFMLRNPRMWTRVTCDFVLGLLRSHSDADGVVA